jgi:glyoxylase-like metal-dependent hydrolase (beta-lactamase superfamily II)
MDASSRWTDLGSGIRVRKSAAFEMNSVLLLDREHVVVVDPGILATELDDLARAVDSASPAAVTLVFTHGHWDHVIGRPWWPNASTLAHDRFAAAVKQDAARTLAEIQKLAAQHGETWERGFTPFRPDVEVSGLHFTKLGSWRLVARDAFGHADHQLSFHLPDHRMLIAADMLSDVEPPILNGPVDAYLDTLRALRPLVAGGAISTLVPGHGSIARTGEAVSARLERDLEYLERLKGEVAPRGVGLTLEATQERLAGCLPDSAGRRFGQRAAAENVAFAYRG